MKVSVIMPAFNRRPFIGTALRSLLDQRDAADLDIIVIDDGSTDGTAEVVEELIEQAPCIRLIRQENKGIAGARNAGLENIPADADLVTFLDSDDVSCAGHFAAVIPLFRADADLAMSYSLITMTNQIDSETLLPAAGAQVSTSRRIHLSAAVFRKSVMDETGTFNEDFVQAEDVDFLLRCFGKPKKYALVDQIAALYRRHTGNTTGNEKDVQRHFLRVLLAHAQRRRLDPTLGGFPDFIDLMTPMTYETDTHRPDPNLAQPDLTI